MKRVISYLKAYQSTLCKSSLDDTGRVKRLFGENGCDEGINPIDQYALVMPMWNFKSEAPDIEAYEQFILKQYKDHGRICLDVFCPGNLAKLHPAQESKEMLIDVAMGFRAFRTLDASGEIRPASPVSRSHFFDSKYQVKSTLVKFLHKQFTSCWSSVAKLLAALYTIAALSVEYSDRPITRDVAFLLNYDDCINQLSDFFITTKLSPSALRGSEGRRLSQLIQSIQNPNTISPTSSTSTPDHGAQLYFSPIPNSDHNSDSDEEELMLCLSLGSENADVDDELNNITNQTKMSIKQNRQPK